MHRAERNAHDVSDFLAGELIHFEHDEDGALLEVESIEDALDERCGLRLLETRLGASIHTHTFGDVRRQLLSTMMRATTRRGGDTKANAEEPARELRAAVKRREPPVHDDEDFLVRVLELRAAYAEALKGSPDEGCMVAMNAPNVQGLRTRAPARALRKHGQSLTGHELGKRRHGEPHDVDASRRRFASKKVHA